MTIRMPNSVKNKTIKYFSSILYFGKHTHIYCNLILYNIHFNIEDNEQNNGLISKKEDSKDNRRFVLRGEQKEYNRLIL
jgi:hypothetical protein